MMPIISIILPTYNGEKYIRKSIDSILNQTFKDWELIIVNDCSTDGTKHIIEEYARQDIRIKVINNDENKKLPNSLNIGFEHSVGEYLTWTSDDNMYCENALHEMFYELEKESKKAMVVANMTIIDKDDDVVDEEITCGNELLLLKNSIGACFLYKRDVLKNIGQYDNSLFLVEDYDYWIRIFRHYGEILHINKFLYKYRRHNESLSIQKQRQVNESLIKLREKHGEYICWKLSSRPDLLFQIVSDNVEKGYQDCKVNSLIANILPMVNPILLGLDDNQIILFGAGKIGRKYIESINKKIECIIDNNNDLDGKTIHGVKIKTTKDLEKYRKDMLILITMSLDKQYDVALQLWRKGFTNYRTWSGA